MMRLCVYGLAGSGKSTASRYLRDSLIARRRTVEIIKLAEPLYRLQATVYDTAGTTIGQWDHDNELLRTLATQLRRVNPTCLVDEFLTKVHASQADVVINDDLRDTWVDYPRMRDDGFHFAYVTADDHARVERLAARGDRNVVPDSEAHWGFDRIAPDAVIDNSSADPIAMYEQLTVLLDKWQAAIESPP